MPRALAVLAGSVLVACGGSSDGSSDGAPVDPCAPSPCVNGGSCGAVDGVAVCTCAGAWTGPTCATPAACDAGSFHDGTACVSCAPIAGCAEVTCAGANTSVCTRCAEGFEPDGDACRASDDCAGDPCGAHGACTDLPGAYRCTCDDGFYDDARTCAPCPSVPHCAAWSCSGPADSRCDRCEAGWEHDGRGGCSEIDPCEGAPCGDGTCVRLAADDYRCECDDGFYDSGARCARCASVAFCAAWTCTGASDSQCTSCIDGYDADGDGGCVPTPHPCRDVLPLVVGTRHGDTHGEVDDASGCTLPFSDGSTFVVGEGAEDETWSFELAARTRVTITVTGFDAALYLLGGGTCSGAALVDGACADFLADASESLSADLNAGRYWVIVDGFAAFGGSTAGTYAITLETASPCADGSYATATSCRPCGAISGCLRTSCTSASDATCVQCAEGRVLDAAGQCQLATCELALEPGVVAQGNTLGKGDDSAGCELSFSDGSTFVVGDGAEDEVWSLELEERALVQITVTGFDAAIYLQRGPSCAGAALNEHACVDFEAGASETLVTVLEAGRHWVVVDGYADATGASGGPYEILVELADPCGGVPPEGACLDADAARWCIVPPAGISGSYTATSLCEDDEACREVDGVSRCLPPASATTCERPMAWCDGDTLIWCDEPGPTSRGTCTNGCWPRYAGAMCAPAFTTEAFEARVEYEYKLPNAALSDWSSERRLAPVRGATVLSWRWNGTSYEVLDTAVTASDGSFSVQIASPPSADDVVTLSTMRVKPLSWELSFAIAEPETADGEQAIDSVERGAVYQWSLPATDSGGSFYLATEDGSGVLRLFDVMSLVYENTAELFYRDVEPTSVVVWARVGTTWSCGECFWSSFTDAIGDPMESQMFVPASAIDESYWADSVTLHEAGHWVMAAFGASPGEGGPHFLGIPYFPGQGWSEGWATWLSSDWRSESRFIDKQDGTMFWVDIAARVHSWGGGWPRPVPEDGLLGRIYELEVASMLWRLGIDEEITPNQLYLALGSERARRALRGYTRHSWTLDEESGEPVGVIDTGEPAVMLADFLDALVCNATPEDIAARVDAVTEPDTHYPYPSDAPICVGPPTSSAPAAPSSPSGPPGEHHPSAPFVLEVTGPSALKPYTTLALVARVERAPGVTAPLELTLALPQGARLVSGKQREVITTPERLVHRSYAIAIEEVPGDDLLVMASSEAGWWGGRAEAHYRFGRPAPTRARTPQREGPSLSFRGVRLGPAIPARRLPR